MRIFYINLRRSADRAVTIEAHLTGLGLPAKRIEAVDGTALTAGQRAMHEPGRRLRRGAPPLTDNEIACFLSHRSAWAEIAASERPGVVLEDDTRLSADAPAVLARAADLDFYDLLRLDGYRKRLGLPLGLHLGTRRVVQLCSGPCGANAYALSPEGAARLLATSERVVEPVDIFLDQFQAHGLPVFAVLPYPASLCSSFAAQSTIGHTRAALDLEARRRAGVVARFRRRGHKLRRSCAKAMLAALILARWPARLWALRRLRSWPGAAPTRALLSPAWGEATNSL